MRRTNSGNSGRGFVRAERIATELELLRGEFPGAYIQSNWALIPHYPLPEGWSAAAVSVAFQIGSGYPGAPPYGLYVRPCLRFREAMPQNYSEPANGPPFGGTWGMFSWTVDDASGWHPAVDVACGANLLHWARSFGRRFAEGA